MFTPPPPYIHSHNQDEEIPKVAPKPSRRRDHTDDGLGRKDSDVEPSPQEPKQGSTAAKQPDPEPTPEAEPEPEPVQEPEEPKTNGMVEETKLVTTDTPDSSASDQKSNGLGTSSSEQVSSPTGQTPSETSEGGEKPDTMTYEERREFRRKEREKRLKATAATPETAEPKQSYHEKKQREQLKNAQDNRKKWEKREEESGEK